MTKKEFIETIKKLPLSKVFGLITFRTHELNKEDSIFFQYHCGSRVNFKQFVDFNFNEYNIKGIEKIDITDFGCVIAYVEE